MKIARTLALAAAVGEGGGDLLADHGDLAAGLFGRMGRFGGLCSAARRVFWRAVH